MALCGAVNPGLIGLTGLLPALASTNVLQCTLPTAFHQSLRGCANKSLVGAKSPSTVCVRKGNVYPTLTQQQLDQMRLRRLTSNCNPAQLLTKEPAAHQAKHIMMCSGASCTAACKPCGAMPGGTNAQRCWEYLSHRLEEINQLRSEDDEAEPILVSKLNCLQAQNLLPALAATLPCHGPIAVVYPEGVWYERLTPLVLERIIEEHLLGGHTVRSHVMMGSRAADHHNTVLPALDITRRANPDGHWACQYAF